MSIIINRSVSINLLKWEFFKPSWFNVRGPTIAASKTSYSSRGRTLDLVDWPVHVILSRKICDSDSHRCWLESESCLLLEKIKKLKDLRAWNLLLSFWWRLAKRSRTMYPKDFYIFTLVQLAAFARYTITLYGINWEWRWSKTISIHVTEELVFILFILWIEKC